MFFVFETPLPSPELSVPEALLRVHFETETGPYNVRISIPERKDQIGKCVSFSGGLVLLELAEDGAFLGLQLQDLPRAGDDAEPFLRFLKGTKEPHLVVAALSTAKFAWLDPLLKHWVAALTATITESAYPDIHIQKLSATLAPTSSSGWTDSPVDPAEAFAPSCP